MRDCCNSVFVYLLNKCSEVVAYGFYCRFIFDSYQNDARASVATSCLLISESAPFASSWSILVSLIKDNVLDWMSKAKFLDTCTPCHVSTHFNNWKVVDQLLGIRLMGLLWKLIDIGIPIFVVKAVLGVAELSHLIDTSDRDHSEKHGWLSDKLACSLSWEHLHQSSLHHFSLIN